MHLSKSKHKRPSYAPTFIGIFEYTGNKATVTTKAGDVYFIFETYRRWYIHGDIVEIIPTRRSENTKLPEAKIIKLISQSSKPLLAIITTSRWSENKWNPRLHLRLVHWFGDRTIRSWVPITGKDGDIVIIRLEWWPTTPTAKILRYLWNKDEDDIDEKVILFRHDVRTLFSDEVQQEANWFQSPTPHTISTGSFEFSNQTFPYIAIDGQNRADFRSWYTTTIDGSDAKDLDDAISILTLPNGNTLLWVHIADVSEYVQHGSKLDHEAFLRGTSIYMPGKVIPMLPEHLSNHLCSLHPWSPKYTLSILLEINTLWHVLQTHVTESIIESNHRSTYDEVFEYIIQQDNTLHDEEWNTTINTSYTLYKALEKRRKKEGKILFTTTECMFRFRWDGTIADIQKRERNEAHMLIEECMVLANEEIAKWCQKKKIPFLSRIHAAPNREVVPIIRSILWQEAIDTQEITPKIIREALDSALPNEYYRLSRLLLPKMSKAIYAEEPLLHFWLALEFYSHFTSPIRRYPDLILHRIIKYFLRNHSAIYTQKELKIKAEKSSERERNAEVVSRIIEDIHMCRFMKQYVGETWDGIISGVTESNIYVELPNGAEWSIFIRWGNLLLHPLTGSLRTREGKEFYRIGNSIQVSIISIDETNWRIELSETFRQ